MVKFISESFIKKAKNIIGKENLEFVHHSKNYLSAQFLLKSLGFLSIPVFTRLLTPDEYGILAVFTSVISIFSVILSLGFYAAIKRYYFEDSNDFDQALGSNLTFLFLFNILSIFIIYGTKNYFSSFFEINSNLFFIGIVVSSLTVFWRIYLGYLQAKKDSKSYSIISTSKSVVLLLLSITWVWYLTENRYMGSVYANLLISSVFSIYIFYNLLKISSFEFSFKYVKYSLKFGIPLLPAMLSSFILASFDIIIINQLEGSTNTGLYSFAYNIGMLMEMLILATANSWQPIFYEEFGNKNYLKLDRMAYNYSKYIYLSAVLLILFSKELVMILADKSYHVALNLVPIIVLGYLCFYLYTLYGHYTTYRKKTYLSSLYTMVAGIINIGLNYLLIPKFGYYIAAYTTFISYFVLFLLYYLNAKFILKDHVISLGKIFPNFLIVLLIGIIYVVITNYVNLYLIVLLVKLIITACSIYYFLFRKNLYYVGGRNQILF